jgi:peptidoglycan LD-endopeptidase LytH
VVSEDREVRRRACRIAGCLAVLLGLLGLGCPDDGVFRGSPHERYGESLRSADLAETELGRAWLRASTHALEDAPRVDLPYREVGYFDPARPEAVALEVELPQGQRLEARAEAEPPSGEGWFFDLMRRHGDGWETVTSADTAGEGPLQLSRRADESQVFVVRLQPELLRGGRYELFLEGVGSLAFPVEGAGPGDIGSGFGAPRSQGARSHRGVDIFAPRGAPVLAPTDGWVTRVGENRLGGNVVHMRGGGLSFYFAHLERQSVGTAARVRAGDVLGEVGNSGNARGTPPHLHFGVFRGDEAVDPYSYLVDLGAGSPPVRAPLRLLGEWARSTAPGLRLRGGPGTGYPIVDELREREAVRVNAAVRDWYRVRTTAGRAGFVAARLASGTDEPLNRRTLDRAVEVLAEPSAGAPPVASLSAGSSVTVRATAGDLLLVTSQDGAEGWIPAG